MFGLMAMTRPAFGPFILDSERCSLLRDGKRVALSQRGLAILQALVEADGQPVGRASLIEGAWPGIVVEDGNLTVQVAALRKALGPTEDGLEWIVTVPRFGYRLLRDTSIEGPSPLFPSVAVLPFANLSGDPTQDYFADGVVEDIITALSRSKSFTVVARNSSFVYKGRAVDVRDVAAELGVRYVLEGSVRRASGRLRVSAQLIDAQAGTHLWARNFDGSVENVFDVQDQITEGVASVVEPHIRTAEIVRSRRKRPESLDAYDLYLRGLAKLYTWRIEDNAEAYALLIRALAIDPNFPPALAKAVHALEGRHNMGWPALTHDDRTTCLELCARALACADGDATILANCAVALMNPGHEYDVCLEVIASALEANPNNLVAEINAGIIKLHCGSLEESLSHSRRALAMSRGDPNENVVITAIAHANIALGNYERGLQAAQRSLAFNPNYNPTFWMLIAANAHLGRMSEAHRWLASFRTLAPSITIARLRAAQPAKIPGRIAPILDGLRLAGLPEA